MIANMKFSQLQCQLSTNWPPCSVNNDKNQKNNDDKKLKM